MKGNLYIDKSYCSLSTDKDSDQSKILDKIFALEDLSKRFVIHINGASIEDFKHDQAASSGIYDSAPKGNAISICFRKIRQLQSSSDEIMFEGNADYSVDNLWQNSNKKQAGAKASDAFLNSIVFTDIHDANRTILENKYGIAIITKELTYVDFINKEPMLSFAKKEEPSDSGLWTSSIGYIGKANSLVLMDKYILCQKQNVEFNLAPILDSCLTQSGTISVQVSICSQFDAKDSDLTNIDDVVQEIKEHYRAPIKLEIIKSGAEFHDRVLITNKGFACAVGGFDLHKLERGSKRDSKSTSIISADIMTVLSKKWLFKMMCFYLNTAIKYKKEHTQLCQPAKIFNRLLDE